jgi:hypothetical protein
MAVATEKAFVVMTTQVEDYRMMNDVADRLGGASLRYHELKQKTCSD